MSRFIKIHDADNHGETVLLAISEIVSVVKSSHGGSWITRKGFTSIHSWEEMDKIESLINEAEREKGEGK